MTKNYNPNLYERPNTTVDTAIFTVFDNDLHVLLIKREDDPFKGFWSLVGGFIDIQKDDDLESTAKRKLEEKTGVKTPYLEQYGSIGNKTRDPRYWSVTNIYFALIPCDKVKLAAGKGATDIKWSKVYKNNVKDKLAFDHEVILKKCIERIRSKVLYTSIPTHFMRKRFTLQELQKIYEIILDKKLEHKSFRRRVLSSNILEETGEMTQDRGRPAMLYKLKKLNYTHFFLRNIET